jgi:hypothetical protein
MFSMSTMCENTDWMRRMRKYPSSGGKYSSSFSSCATDMYKFGIIICS